MKLEGPGEDFVTVKNFIMKEMLLGQAVKSNNKDGGRRRLTKGGRGLYVHKTSSLLLSSTTSEVNMSQRREKKKKKKDIINSSSPSLKNLPFFFFVAFHHLQSVPNVSIPSMNEFSFSFQDETPIRSSTNTNSIQVYYIVLIRLKSSNVRTSGTGCKPSLILPSRNRKKPHTQKVPLFFHRCGGWNWQIVEWRQPRTRILH